ncbi:TIGR03746 family integrating conjugative element protein, partial [Escherichia coli]|nr:TIGR03746 family integrating conjugative element protein [Escherichia coli]EGD5143681.1 TIGR03746 family integrating conjugative element protein [Escherichia coli]EIA9096948.1 TIGR03746 family integrating conjugative element protein [Escherichia coli]EIH7425522.1 TIGR03746 family integrating conjugative element protein [Escherichia coli]
MSRFRHALKDRDQHILTLRVFSGVLCGLLLMVTIGWMTAPDRLTIHNPPDLRSGSTRPWWEVPPSTVYSFAFYIFQQLNAWPKNGEVDYPAKIHALSAYLTPSCREILETDARRRKDAGELLDRVRVVYEIPEHGYGGRYNRDPVT